MEIVFGIMLFVAPLVIIPGVFIIARRVEKTDAAEGSLLFRSWLVGFLGLVPGLAIVTHHEYNACFICLESAPETLGWPFSWLGYNLFGNLFVPLFILGNIFSVAMIYFMAHESISLILTFLIKRSLSDSTIEAGKVVLALVVLLFPAWGGFALGGTAIRAAMFDEPDQKQITGTIQLQCTNIRMDQSPKYPGIKAIEVDVLAQTPGDYEIRANLQDAYGNRIPDSDEHIDNLHTHRGYEGNKMYFIFHPVDHSTLLPTVKSNGPYTILFYNVADDRKPIAECWTPAYSLGGFIIPTPTPSNTPIPTPIPSRICLKLANGYSCNIP